MKKQRGFILIELGLYVTVIVLLIFCVWGFIATGKKQEREMLAFMAECLQDQKQYECDVLWSQTDASKQVRDAAIGFAAGATIGAMAGKR